MADQSLRPVTPNQVVPPTGREGQAGHIGYPPKDMVKPPPPPPATTTTREEVGFPANGLRDRVADECPRRLSPKGCDSGAQGNALGTGANDSHA